MTVFRPMLAENYDPAHPIKFPVLVSPKIDGIRCLIRWGQPLTRRLKPVPNRHISAALHGLPDFDGELVVGDPTKPTTWNTTSSAVMRHEGEPAFTYYVFDMNNAGNGASFESRMRIAESRAGMYGPRVRYLHHHYVESWDELVITENEYIRAGYEGLMIRAIDGPYKHGRSTAKEGYLLKMKRFDDLEATVVGVTERLRHIGDGTINALGLMERDDKAEHLVGTGTLGAFICQIAGSSGTECTEFQVGSGFNATQREIYWEWAKTETAYDPIGKVVKIKHHGFTPDGKPRFPIFLGFRDDRDMSP